jgi:ethanolamine utilization protein EutN
MMVGRVVGQVWSTRKFDGLSGLRFLLVRPLVADRAAPLRGRDAPEGAGELELGTDILVAADPVGAGDGELVILAFGRAARTVIGRGHEVGYQTAVIGIVDQIQLAGGEVVEAHEPPRMSD